MEYDLENESDSLEVKDFHKKRMGPLFATGSSVVIISMFNEKLNQNNKGLLKEKFKTEKNF